MSLVGDWNEIQSHWTDQIIETLQLCGGREAWLQRSD